jgi:hypothetical protein
MQDIADLFELCICVEKQYFKSQYERNKLVETSNKYIESRCVANSCTRDLIVSGNSELCVEVNTPYYLCIKFEL